MAERLPAIVNLERRLEELACEMDTAAECKQEVDSIVAFTELFPDVIDAMKETGHSAEWLQMVQQWEQL